MASAVRAVFCCHIAIFPRSAQGRSPHIAAPQQLQSQKNIPEASSKFPIQGSQKLPGKWRVPFRLTENRGLSLTCPVLPGEINCKEDLTNFLFRGILTLRKPHRRKHLAFLCVRRRFAVKNGTVIFPPRAEALRSPSAKHTPQIPPFPIERSFKR